MSNSPTPPAQDGERERLVANARKAVRCLYIAVDECVARDCSAAVNAALDAQSAELAALRAQVAERMLELEAWRHEWNVAFSHASKNKNRRWVLRCLKDAVDASLDAALAPPQPVAKET